MNHSTPTAVNASSAMISSSEAITHPVPLPHLTNAKNGRVDTLLFPLLLLRIVAQEMLIPLKVNLLKDAFLSTQSDFPKTSLRKMRFLTLSEAIKGVRFLLGQVKKASFVLLSPWKMEVRFPCAWSKSQKIFKFVLFPKLYLRLNRSSPSLHHSPRIMVPFPVQPQCPVFFFLFRNGCLPHKFPVVYVMINSVSNLSSSVLTGNSNNREVASNSQLQMDDFLQLLTSQITNQDPLEPMKDTEFISQMANIASLEQMEQFSKGFTKFADSQNGLLAQSYLGNTVEISDEGETITGVVEAVDQK